MTLLEALFFGLGIATPIVLAAVVAVWYFMRPAKPERDPVELMAEDAEKIRKVAEMYEAQSRAQLERMGSHE